MDEPGMPHRNVMVYLAVNQQHWDRRRSCRVLRRNPLDIEPVLPACTQKRGFDQRSQKRSPNPRAEVEGLPHTVVSDFSKTCEGRLDCHGRKANRLAFRIPDGVKLQGAVYEGTKSFSGDEPYRKPGYSDLNPPAQPPNADPHVRWGERGGRAIGLHPKTETRT